MVWVGRDLHRSFKSPSHSNIANFFLIFFYLVWILYPVAWGLSEGGNVIQPDSSCFLRYFGFDHFRSHANHFDLFAIKGCDEEFSVNFGNIMLNLKLNQFMKTKKLLLKLLQPKRVLLTLKLIMNLKLKFRV